MDRQLQWAVRLSSGAILLALVVVLLGGWTRLNDAGLGCPDWPGCYGEMILPSGGEALQAAQARYPERMVDQHKGWLEMIHRYAAGTLGLVIMGIALLALRMRERQMYPLGLSLGLLGLVIVQGLFGMWTVTWKLLPQVVTLHLLGGLLTLTLLVRLRHRLLRLLEEQPPLVPGRAIRAGLLLLFLQLGLGGWTSANYAGWACTDWISCNSEVNIEPDYRQGFEPAVEIGPDYEGGLRPVEARAAIQIVHRWMAVVLVAYLLWLGWQSLRTGTGRWGGLLIVAAVGQAGIGIANVIWALPLMLATAHHAGAVLLLLCLLWLYEQSGRLSTGGVE